MRTPAFLLLLTVSLSCFYAQDFNSRHIKTDAEKFPYVISSVQVYDSFDEPITNLKENNFAVSVDSKRTDSLKVNTYKDSGLGLNILLCLDLSGSMNGRPLVTMKDAIYKFIDDMRSVDKLGVMGFADDANLISDFSNDKDFLKEKIKSLTTSGNQTALFYGTYKGLNKLAENKEHAGKILLLIGDGRDENKSGSYKEDDIIELGKKEGIPVFTIGYTKIDRSYLQSLERISGKTGGNFYNSPSDEDLSKQYQKLYRQILNIYLVSYLALNTEGDGAEHINVITVSQNGTGKSVSARFIAPAGIRSVESSTKITETASVIPLWGYIAGGVFILSVCGLVFFLITRNKKKKREEAKKILEEEQKHNGQLEEEKKKRLELEKKLEESKSVQYPKDPVPATGQAKEERTVIHPVAREDRTMILMPEIQRESGLKSLRIEIQTGSCQGERFDVSVSGATIGRKDTNSLVIKEETMSGSHAKISWNGMDYFIEDSGSSNGTFINGRAISAPTLINHGDVFKFGKCEGVITIY
ncbi:MAG: VWA domain-containing protein [Ignavibacteria bacterium]